MKKPAYPYVNDQHAGALDELLQRLESCVDATSWAITTFVRAHGHEADQRDLRRAVERQLDQLKGDVMALFPKEGA
jgi:hypothetical protein